VGADARRHGRPSRRASSGPERCRGGHKSGPGDIAVDGRHIWTPEPGRRWPRSAGRPRSARWRRRLHDTVLASPAGIFGPPGDEHPELRRDDSSRSLLSSPIRCSSPWQHGQVLSSMSATISIRGRCATLGEQHRFQRLGIIRQCVARHHQIRSYLAELCDGLPGS
jgi:hypothetical protein